MLASSSPFPVTLHRTGANRNAVAALLGVLEAELPPGLVQTRLIRSLEAFDGEGLLVCSFMTSRAAVTGAELRGLSERCGRSLLAVAGGPHPSADPEGTRGMGFRWVGRGEAGPSFAALVGELARGGSPAPGLLAEDPRRDLDRYPAWPRSGQLFAQLELTRGCPISCAYCQTPFLHGREPRHRSLAEVRRLLEHAVATGHSFTRFVTPNAFAYGSPDGRTPNPRAVEALLGVARRAGMQKVFLGNFPSEVRPETVTPELVGLIKGGCDNRHLVVGLQSGSPAMLARLRRGHTVEEGLRAVRCIAAAGLVPWVDFIFGLPGESDADRASTRDLIRHLASSYGVRIDTHLFTPLPGTPLARAAPGVLDPLTRDLLLELIGRGQANGVRCFVAAVG